MSAVMTGGATLARQAYETIANMLHETSGLRIGPDKLYLLETRLTPVLRHHGVRDLAALADALCKGTASRPLIADLNDAMTTNETSFFRDVVPFDHLGTDVLPALHSARPPGQPLRIWSAASSTGQEAYTIAMVAAELGTRLRDRPIEIVGTDLSAAVVARAAEGRYSAFEIGRGLPARLQKAYFISEPGGGARVGPALRSTVRFRKFNLLDDMTCLGRFDIIFIRNVLIYFDLSTKRKVLERMARQLAPDGVLYLGGAETVQGVTDRFRRESSEPCCRLSLPNVKDR